MMFVIVLIMGAVLAYLIGFIKTLQGRIETLERHVDVLSFKINKLPKEPQEAHFSVEEPETETVSESMTYQPPVFETLIAKKAEAMPRYEAVPEPPPVLEPVATYAREEEMPPRMPVAEPVSEFNWEQFLGAKMLAWLGGLALFVGIAFFVKYSFDRDLIPPWLRVVAGFTVGLGLVIAGVKIRTKQYLITAQTFVATGIVILYAVSFIARSFYHLIDTPLLFVLMCGVTVMAFTLAIRLDGQVIAVLGMLGGFITPQLVGVSREHPFALFGYVLVLNCGLLAVARRQNWSFLIPLAAISTVLTEMIWMVAALRPENLIATLLMIGAVTALFVGNARFNPDPAEEPRSMFAGTLQSMVVLVTFWFVLYQHQPGPVILLSTLFFGNIALIALYAMTLQVLPLILAVSCCGGLLALWIASTGSVFSACIAVLLYAGLNALLPAWIAKWRESSQAWPNIASVSGVALMLLVLFRDSSPGWFFWPAVLLLNAVLLGVAFIRQSMILGLCGMALSAVLSIYWINHLSNTASLVEPLVIIGAFALLYFFAAGPLSRRQKLADPNAIYFPAIPAAIPFFLLALLIVRVEIPNPSLLFGFAMLLNALLILAAPGTASAFPLVALIGSLLLQALWFTTELKFSNAPVSFAWFLGFSVAFTFFPLLRRRSEPVDWLRWSVSAVAGPIHFGLLCATVRIIWPEMSLPGLVPALLGLPALAMLLITRKLSAMPEEQQQFTAIYGASLLFFITFIFPIQFDRQWLTLGWALEGAALIWLHRRAPAQWLVALGSGLLAAAFVRLALNPLVFRYHERSEIPVLNWYLYTYGIVAMALFAAARLMTKNEYSAQLKGAFNGMATVLLFLLINIQIADIFASGPYLAFEFSGNFARDMVYSIAWSLFALALLIAGVRKEAPVVRYAGLGLMGITLLKLFLHDLTQLDALFRIGAFVGVAIILIFASWLYQRFLSPSRKVENSD